MDGSRVGWNYIMLVNKNYCVYCLGLNYIRSDLYRGPIYKNIYVRLPIKEITSVRRLKMIQQTV